MESGAHAPGEVLIEGRIVIAAGVVPLDGATVHVRLEDVSTVDAASSLVAETVIYGVRSAADSNETAVPFVIRASVAIDARADYAVRVWIDRDGDGSPGEGDLHSDCRYPVITGGFGQTVDIVIGSAGVISNAAVRG